MAKPQKSKYNGPNIPEGKGERADETGGEGEETGKGGKGGEGKERAKDDNPPSSPTYQPDRQGVANQTERESRRR